MERTDDACGEPGDVHRVALLAAARDLARVLDHDQLTVAMMLALAGRWWSTRIENLAGRERSH